MACERSTKGGAEGGSREGIKEDKEKEWRMRGSRKEVLGRWLSEILTSNSQNPHEDSLHSKHLSYAEVGRRESPWKISLAYAMLNTE